MRRCGITGRRRTIEKVARAKLDSYALPMVASVRQFSVHEIEKYTGNN